MGEHPEGCFESADVAMCSPRTCLLPDPSVAGAKIDTLIVLIYQILRIDTGCYNSYMIKAVFKIGNVCKHLPSLDWIVTPAEFKDEVDSDELFDASVVNGGSPLDPTHARAMLPCRAYILRRIIRLG